MLKILRTLALLGLGLTTGFLIAYFAGWTGVLEIQKSTTDYKYLVNKDGDILRVPTHEDSFSLSAHSESYRPSPVVDLFDNKDDKK